MNDFFNWDEIEKRCGGAQSRLGGDRDTIRKRRLPSARFFPAAMHDFSTMSETDKDDFETDDFDFDYDDLISSRGGRSDESPANAPLPPQSPLPAPALAAVPPSPLSMRGGRHGGCTTQSSTSTRPRGRFSMHDAALQLASPISPFFMEQNAPGRASSDLTSLKLTSAVWQGGEMTIDSTNNSSNANNNSGNCCHHHHHVAKSGHTLGMRRGAQRRSSRHGCLTHLPKTQTNPRRPRIARSLSVTEVDLFLLSLRRLEEVQAQRAALAARTTQSKDHLAKQYRRLTEVEPPAQSSASTLAYADGNSDEDADDEEDETSSDDEEVERTYGALDTHHARLVRQLQALDRVNDDLRRRYCDLQREKRHAMTLRDARLHDTPAAEAADTDDAAHTCTDPLTEPEDGAKGDVDVYDSDAVRAFSPICALSDTPDEPAPFTTTVPAMVMRTSSLASLPDAGRPSYCRELMSSSELAMARHRGRQKAMSRLRLSKAVAQEANASSDELGSIFPSTLQLV